MYVYILYLPFKLTAYIMLCLYLASKSVVLDFPLQKAFVIVECVSGNYEMNCRMS